MFGKRKDPNDKVVDFIVSAEGALTLYPNRIEHRAARKVHQTIPLAEVTAIRAESGAALEARVTMTRMVALGLLAFAAKKKSGGEVFITVEAGDAFVSLMVDRKKATAAHKFVAQAETLRRAAGAPVGA